MLVLTASAGDARAQSAPDAPTAPARATTEVKLDQPSMVLQATDAWANWHTYWMSRQVVCSAPCVAVVPREGTYRVVADGMLPSSLFSLPARDRVRLEVHPGRRGAHDAGALLMIFGACVGLVGAAVLAGGGSKATEIGGGVSFGAGTAMVGIGLSMLLSTGTTVHFD